MSPAHVPTVRSVLRPALFVAALSLVGVLAPAAGAGHDDGPWPQGLGEGGQRQVDDISGPEHLAVDWATEAGGTWSVPGAAGGNNNVGSEYLMALDGHGHLLATGDPHEYEDGGEGLLALNQETGQTSWSIRGVSARCKPAVSNGYVWALLEIQGEDDPERLPSDPDRTRWALVAIDPSDGQLVPGLRYAPAAGSLGCNSHMRVAGDGTVFVQGHGVHQEGTEDEHPGPMLHAVDPTDATAAWVAPVAHCSGGSPWVPPAGAPNADTIYLPELEQASPHDDCGPIEDPSTVQVRIRAIDLATGQTRDTTIIPGNTWLSRRHGFVRDDGDLVVATGTVRTHGSAQYRGSIILRLTDSGDGGLTTSWRIDVPDEGQDCATEAMCRRPIALADGGDRVMTTFRNQEPKLLSLDADDGSLVWRYVLNDPPYAHGNLAVDQEGTTYVEVSADANGNPQADPVESVTRHGLRASFLAPAQAEILGLSVNNLGPIGPDGRVFGWSSNAGWFALDTAAEGCPRGEMPDAFEDDDGGFHEPGIDCVAWWGVSQGDSEGNFNPAHGVTRGEMAAFLVGLLEASGAALPSDPPDHFSDDDGGFFEYEINVVAESGIAQGTREGAFTPGRHVTRGEMAAFLRRTYQYRVDAADAALVPHVDAFTDDDGPFETDINQVFEMGVAAGTGADRFTPGRTVTRGEMATFLSRLLEELAGQGIAAPPSS